MVGRAREGRVGHIFYRGPPAILEPFGDQNGVKRASKNLSTKTVSKIAPLGSPRDPQEAPRQPKRHQNAFKRFPKEFPKSMILRFGQETSENVKIAFLCMREFNFQGSGTFEIELFW